MHLQLGGFRIMNIVKTPAQLNTTSTTGGFLHENDFTPPTTTDQEKILALLASWSFHRKPTAKQWKFSIEKVVSITKNRL